MSRWGHRSSCRSSFGRIELVGSKQSYRRQSDHSIFEIGPVDLAIERGELLSLSAPIQSCILCIGAPAQAPRKDGRRNYHNARYFSAADQNSSPKRGESSLDRAMPALTAPRNFS
jgi:hypothetical protein